MSDLELFREATAKLLPPMGIPMDYSKSSLQKIEQFINSLFPKEGKPMSPTTIIPFGYYLGETLVRNFPNAKWVLAKNVYDITVRITLEEEKHINVSPFIRALKFFEDRTDSIVAMYDLVDLHINKGGLDLENEADGEWKVNGNLQYRMWKEKKPNGDHKN